MDGLQLNSWRTVRNRDELDLFLEFFDDLPLASQESIRSDMLQFLEDRGNTVNALAAAQHVTSRRRRKRRRLS